MNDPPTQLTMAVRQACRCDRRARCEVREVRRHPPWLIHEAANDVTIGTSRVSKERALRVGMISCRLRLIGKPAIELRARLNDHWKPWPCRRPDTDEPHLTNGRCSRNEYVLPIAPRKANPVVGPGRLHTRPLQREAFASGNVKLVCGPEGNSPSRVIELPPIASAYDPHLEVRDRCASGQSNGAKVRDNGTTRREECCPRQPPHRHPAASTTDGDRPAQYGERPRDDGNRINDEHHDDSSRKTDPVSRLGKSKESAIG